ncbi:hypothetical protein F0U60_51665 [Archangium minus]|uniref:Lipoprotein n=2 Tax=Archangium minus TaxID=83450 RepID=A0ABY9X8C7_9BACT|nr:hypothetical protein F0U60_51665 [Archangium minus]
MPLNANRLHPDRSACWRFTSMLLASMLLGACATHPARSGARPRSDLRLDTESVARVRHASLLGTTTTSAAPLTVASSLARVAPVLLVVLGNHGKVDELEESLKECARQAEYQVNSSLFGNRAPTREECGEELEVDGCGEPITRAMLLGRQKHVIALACAREVLTELWPAPFSIEQRYRYYRASRFIETISQEEEQRLIDQGCTRELWRTIKPDIVLHKDYNLLQAVIILDFKFPCPPTNPAQWKQYGQKSAYSGLNQGEVYKEALGGEVFLLTP